MESHISRLFRDVWAKENRTFRYWYDLERKEYQGHLRKAVIKSQQDRIQTMLAFRPGVEMSLEEMGKMMLSPAEALNEGLKHIMRFPRDGGDDCLKSATEWKRVSETQTAFRKRRS